MARELPPRPNRRIHRRRSGTPPINASPVNPGPVNPSPATLHSAPDGKLIAILDTGAISALSPATERGRARLRVLRERVDELAMPAAVLAEGLLTGHPGRDYHVRRLLEFVAIDSVDEHLGFAAGQLRTQCRRAGTDPPPSGIDAIVVALADAHAVRDEVLIVTSDPEDITALAIHTTTPHRLKVQPA